jgi:hypothetical protein
MGLLDVAYRKCEPLLLRNWQVPTSRKREIWFLLVSAKWSLGVNCVLKHSSFAKRHIVFACCIHNPDGFIISCGIGSPNKSLLSAQGHNEAGTRMNSIIAREIIFVLNLACAYDERDVQSLLILVQTCQNWPDVSPGHELLLFWYSKQ